MLVDVVCKPRIVSCDVLGSNATWKFSTCFHETRFVRSTASYTWQMCQVRVWNYTLLFTLAFAYIYICLLYVDINQPHTFAVPEVTCVSSQANPASFDFWKWLLYAAHWSSAYLVHVNWVCVTQSSCALDIMCGSVSVIDLFQNICNCVEVTHTNNRWSLLAGVDHLYLFTIDVNYLFDIHGFIGNGYGFGFVVDLYSYDDREYLGSFPLQFTSSWIKAGVVRVDLRTISLLIDLTPMSDTCWDTHNAHDLMTLLWQPQWESRFDHSQRLSQQSFWIFWFCWRSAVGLHLSVRYETCMDLCDLCDLCERVPLETIFFSCEARTNFVSHSWRITHTAAHFLKDRSWFAWFENSLVQHVQSSCQDRFILNLSWLHGFMNTFIEASVEYDGHAGVVFFSRMCDVHRFQKQNTKCGFSVMQARLARRWQIFQESFGTLPAMEPYPLWLRLNKFGWTDWT